MTVSAGIRNIHTIQNDRRHCGIDNMEDSQKQKTISKKEGSDQLDQRKDSRPMNIDIAADLTDNSKNIDFILNLPLDVTVEYGRARKKIIELLEFKKGTVVELDKLKGEPVDIRANNKLIAKGEVLVEDDKYGIKITEIVSRLERIKRL